MALMPTVWRAGSVTTGRRSTRACSTVHHVASAASVRQVHCVAGQGIISHRELGVQQVQQVQHYELKILVELARLVINMLVRFNRVGHHSSWDRTGQFNSPGIG